MISLTWLVGAIACAVIGIFISDLFSGKAGEN